MVTSKNRHTHAFCIAVPLVWGSLWLAPITANLFPPNCTPLEY